MADAGIVTITSDLGMRDPYVAMLKGALLKGSPALNIIDTAHDLRKHDLEQVAYIMRQTIPQFMPGTVHMGICDLNYDNNQTILIAQWQEQWILCTDNGLIPLITDNVKEVYAVKAPTATHPSFLAIDWLIPFALRLANREQPVSFAKPTTNYSRWLAMSPSISTTSIRANVIYIDGYDNVVLNVKEKEFQNARQNRHFRVELFRDAITDDLSRGYDDAQQGQALVLFNSAGYMEIAINKGKASSLLNLKLRDSILIEFY